MSPPAPGRWGGRAAGLALAAALLVALALTAKLPPSPRILVVLHDAAHAPFGAALALVAWAGLGLRRAPPAGLVRHLIAFALALAIGALVEVAQAFVGRGPSFHDLWTDALGAACALGSLAWASARAATDAAVRRGRFPAAAVAVVSGALALAPLVEAGAAYARRAAQFPVILGLEGPLDDYFIDEQPSDVARVPLPADWRAAGDPRRSLRVSLAPGSWPAIPHAEPTRDWRGLGAIALDVTNPSPEPLLLVLRIHDATGGPENPQRFEGRFTVAPGVREVLRVPLESVAAGPGTRRLDLSRVAGLILFAPEGQARDGRAFYLTRIRLE